jgi:hypothetical protein
VSAAEVLGRGGSGSARPARDALFDDLLVCSRATSSRPPTRAGSQSRCCRFRHAPCRRWRAASPWRGSDRRRPSPAESGGGSTASCRPRDRRGRRSARSRPWSFRWRGLVELGPAREVVEDAAAVALRSRAPVRRFHRGDVEIGERLRRRHDQCWRREATCRVVLIDCDESQKGRAASTRELVAHLEALPR